MSCLRRGRAAIVHYPDFAHKISGLTQRSAQPLSVALGVPADLPLSGRVGHRYSYGFKGYYVLPAGGRDLPFQQGRGFAAARLAGDEDYASKTAENQHSGWQTHSGQLRNG